MKNIIKKIIKIKKHLKRNKKDKHCRIGLMKNINKKKKYIKYLKKKAKMAERYTR
ncbi:30S ribosomal protein S15 [Candidatus Vidania fulgoroideorum]